METTRLLIASDLHDCHIDWYGVPTAERLACFCRDVQAEYDREPFACLLFLGDYSLDFWQWDIGGSYLGRGVSYTRHFLETVCPRLPAPYYMICGNHEQYGEDVWRTMSGFERQFCVPVGRFLFVLLDTFHAGLDPTEHSDGTYTPLDTAYITACLKRYPDKQLVLCAHHIDMDKEPAATAALLAHPRIVCLFGGHVHRSDIVTLPAACGAKPLLHTGHYSYAQVPLEACMWGFRDVTLSDGGLSSSYIVPAHTVTDHGQTYTCAYHRQDTVTLTC